MSCTESCKYLSRYVSACTKRVLAFEVLGHGTQLSMYNNKIFGLQCTPGSSSRNLGSKVKGELKNLRGYL